VTDVIALLPSHAASIYDNIGNERFLGAEVRARFRAGHAARGATASLDYTFIRSISALDQPGAAGHRVVGIPDHKLDARLELASAPFRLWYEIAYVSEVYTTPQMD